MKRTRLKPRSEAMKEALEPYGKMLALHSPDRCARCGLHGEGWRRFGGIYDPHHPYGRGKGRTAWKTLVFVPVCRPCHDWIHANTNQARSDGWLIKNR